MERLASFALIVIGLKIKASCGEKMDVELAVALFVKIVIVICCRTGLSESWNLDHRAVCASELG